MKKDIFFAYFQWNICDRYGNINLDIYAIENENDPYGKYRYKFCSLDILADDWEIVDD